MARNRYIGPPPVVWPKAAGPVVPPARPRRGVHAPPPIAQMKPMPGAVRTAASARVVQRVGSDADGTSMGFYAAYGAPKPAKPPEYYVAAGKQIDKQIADVDKLVQTQAVSQQYAINKAYIDERLQGLQDAAKAGYMFTKTLLDQVNEALKPGRVLYHIANLKGKRDKLAAGDETLIQKLIDDQNKGEKGNHTHKGVGGAVTKDVTGSSFGGQGRGNARLKFCADGTLELVNHSNQSLI